jgi:hypothetical protein
MRAIAQYAPRACTLAALGATLAFVAVPAVAVAISQHKTPQAHAAAKDITERRARRVMRKKAQQSCQSVEHKRRIKVKVHPDPMLPPVTVHRVVQNGKCLAYSVPYGTCHQGTWTAGGVGVDLYMEMQEYFSCQMLIRWQTNKYTVDGICWDEVGKPTDTNAIIAASRFMEAGYDRRGALRTFVEDWSCRVT